MSFVNQTGNNWSGLNIKKMKFGTDTETIWKKYTYIHTYICVYIYIYIYIYIYMCVCVCVCVCVTERNGERE